ncbi:MAG TPA: hypothetical protein VFB84_04640 [Micromonosporaceae bacterium]|nr:hypothetical protein [Micromonosporaceae bacterium]
MAQSLDNQWVPRRLLDRMVAGEMSLADVAGERQAVVRVEYLRAVLNAEQLVVNRLFFPNNDAIIQDYATPGPGREAFKRLLNEGVLVVYLYTERSPVAESDRDKSRIAAPLWEQAAAETEMSCVRLSWDDEINKTEIQTGLEARFHEFVVNLRSKCLDGGDQVFASHLGIPEARRDALRERLLAASQWAFCRPQRVHREEFYKQFVTVDGTPPAQGRYSSTKPFATELKLLADLAYNTSLPETLDRFPLRASDSLHRAALQEWKQGGRSRTPPVAADTVAEQLILKRLAYDEAMESLPPLPPIEGLDLTQVAAVRRTDEWARYTETLRQLVGNVSVYETKANQLRKDYAAMLGRLPVVGSPRQRTAAGPVLGFNLDIAGVLMRVRYLAGQAVYWVVGRPPALARRTVGMSRVVVATGGGPEREGGPGHHLAADLSPFRVDNPRDVLALFEARLEEAGVRRINGGGAMRDGGLENDEELPA